MWGIEPQSYLVVLAFMPTSGLVPWQESNLPSHQLGGFLTSPCLALPGLASHRHASPCHALLWTYTRRDARESAFDYFHLESAVLRTPITEANLTACILSELDH